MPQLANHLRLPLEPLVLPPPHPAIGELAAEITAACGRPLTAMAAGIKMALARAVHEPDLLTADQRLPRPGCYARHVLHSDRAGRFTILAIVWGPGQFSPAHAHHTWCGYAVYDNPLEEQLFRLNPEQSLAEFVRTEPRFPGYSCFGNPGLDQIHRLGNSGREPAISIHAYGVERACIATHVNRVVDVAP
jgi:predicted metal-dependent enzyme (double-stranded beta helix superfamily)